MLTNPAPGSVDLLTGETVSDRTLELPRYGFRWLLQEEENV